MVELRDGTQTQEPAAPAASNTKSTRSTDGKHSGENDSANKENIEPGSFPDKVWLRDGEDMPNHSTTLGPVRRRRRGGVAKPKKKQRETGSHTANNEKASDEKSGEAETNRRGQKRSAETCSTDADASKRTRKDLEIEWDRSQLRDPRPTPERVLLPRKSEHELTEEELNSFQNPVPEHLRKKGRLNAIEKDQLFREKTKANIARSFHDLYECFDKGPSGSPTYDEAGFQLDYSKVTDWMKPRAYNKSAMVNGMEKSVERRTEEAKKMAALFFEGGKFTDGEHDIRGEELMKDKVSKDLGIAIHKVTLAKVEEWAEKGFPKENAQDYIGSSLTKEERRRFMKMMSGASLRK
jgi:hypothetical protein